MFRRIDASQRAKHRPTYSIPRMSFFRGTLDYKALLATQRFQKIIASATTSTRWLACSSFVVSFFPIFSCILAIHFFRCPPDVPFCFSFFRLLPLSIIFRFSYDFLFLLFRFSYFSFFPPIFFPIFFCWPLFICAYEYIRDSSTFILEPASSPQLNEAHTAPRRASMLSSSIYIPQNSTAQSAMNKSSEARTCRSESGNASKHTEAGESQHVVEHLQLAVFSKPKKSSKPARPKNSTRPQAAGDERRGFARVSSSPAVRS